MAEKKLRFKGPSRSLKRTIKTGCIDKGDIFDPNLPPQHLSLKRLSKQVEDVKKDLHVAKVNPAVRDNLAYTKLSKNSVENKKFRKQCSKKANIDKDDQLFNSLVNLSISSVESLKSLENLGNLAVPSDSLGNSEPSPILEDFFQPYQGEEEEYSVGGELLQTCFLKKAAKQKPDANIITINMREMLFQKLEDLEIM